MAVNAGLDVARIKKDFPILDRVINGKRLVYLDSAATSQKPRSVLDAMERYYETCNANVHRSVYHIAGEATEALRDRAAEGEAVHQRADRTRDRLHEERDRGR